MGNTTDICLGRDHKGPLRFAELTHEEAYMIKRQQDLRLFIYSCEDFERAFHTNLTFQSVSEDEFIEVLTRLKLLKQDNPKETVIW